MEKILTRDTTSTKKIKENVIALTAMLALLPLNIFYVLFNNSSRGVHTLVTKVDNLIPFTKIFILPYVAWYGFIFITMAYLCFKDRETYYTTLVSYIIGLTTCYITFYFFQTTVPRPELAGSDILTKLIILIYNADQPYNCFPSIHVLSSILMVKGIMASNVKNKINIVIVSLASVLIILSTLFIKQHVILDVVSGIIFADIIFRFNHSFGGRIWNWLKVHC